jgi:hypothetical protein
MRRSCIVAGVILVLASIFYLTPPNKVYACLCGPNDHPAGENSANADAVFAGNVTRISEGIDDSSVVAGGFHFESVTFEVTTVWKGVSQAEFVVKDYSTDCGVDFQEGGSYLVYADADDNLALSTSRCMGTKPLSTANDDITALGQGQIIKQASPPGGLATTASVFLFLLALAVVGIVMLRRKTRSSPG